MIFKRGDVFKESRRAQDKATPEYLYQYGKRSNYFIIILTGEATIEVGIEKLEFIAGQFAFFGVNALLNDSESADQILKDVANIRQCHYTPDFSLRVDDRCVYFKIDRDLWLNGVKKSKYEIENSEMVNNIDLNINNTTINTTTNASNNESITVSTDKLIQSIEYTSKSNVDIQRGEEEMAREDKEESQLLLKTLSINELI